MDTLSWQIVAPGFSAAPVDTVQALRTGQLPEFESPNAVNELMCVLSMGLWNRLGRHQDRRSLFRLMRTDLTATSGKIALVALIRAEEWECFIDGSFRAANRLDLPERVHRGVEMPCCWRGEARIANRPIAKPRCGPFAVANKAFPRVRGCTVTPGLAHERGADRCLTIVQAISVPGDGRRAPWSKIRRHASPGLSIRG